MSGEEGEQPASRPYGSLQDTATSPESSMSLTTPPGGRMAVSVPLWALRERMTKGVTDGVGVTDGDLGFVVVGGEVDGRGVVRFAVGVDGFVLVLWHLDTPFPSRRSRTRARLTPQ